MQRVAATPALRSIVGLKIREQVIETQPARGCRGSSAFQCLADTDFELSPGLRLVPGVDRFIVRLTVHLVD
jgi:hypothetical protein